MAINIKSMIKNMSYSVFVNLFSLVVSTLVTIFLPKYISVESYGFWQLYLFYSGYVGILHFGWCDGIYLRYGEKNYEELDKELFSSQFQMFTVFQIIVSAIVLVLIFFQNMYIEKKEVLLLTCLSIILINLKSFVLYILQFTNRIKHYSLVVFLERFLFAIGIFGCIIFKFFQFYDIIIVDLFVKLITVIIAIYLCKEIILTKVTYCRRYLVESFTNLRVGIKLMIGNMMGSLILYVVRSFIESNWSITEFAKISFALTISNMVLLFINAISIVIFPTLKRISQENVIYSYDHLKNLLNRFMFLFFIFIFPLQKIIEMWLPKYTESIVYMIILIPMCIYEGKMSLIVAPYMKVFRLEKQFLIVNTVSVLLAFIGTRVIDNIIYLCFFTVFLFFIRCFLCQLCLKEKINKISLSEVVGEIILIMVYYASIILIDNIFGLFIYVLFYCVVFFVLEKDKNRGIKQFISNLKNI